MMAIPNKTTRTTVVRVVLFFRESGYLSEVFQPLLNVVSSPEVVENKTNPTCGQENHCKDYFPSKVYVFLEYVQYTPNGADKTNNVNNKSHSVSF